MTRPDDASSAPLLPPDWLHRNATAAPDQPAFKQLDSRLDVAATLTWSELHARVAQVAQALAMHTQGGDRVALAFGAGLDFVVAFWACLASGRVAVPVPALDPTRLKHGLPRLRSVLDNAAAAAVLAEGDAIDGIDVPWWSLHHLLAAGGADAGAGTIAPPSTWTNDTLAYLQYTSGSTAAPKGVMLTHANLRAQCEITVGRYPFDAHTRILSWLPHYHDFGLLTAIVLPVYLGACSHLMSPLAFLRRPLDWWRATERYRIHFTGGPNFALAASLRAVRDKHWRGDLSPLQVVAAGAEPIRPDTVANFQATLGPMGVQPSVLTPAYGLAEAVLTVCAKDAGTSAPVLECDAQALGEGRVRRADVGTVRRRALVGCGQGGGFTEVRIVDPETRRACADDVVGEIWLRGPSVGVGYWGNPAASAATFGAMLADGGGPYLRTGDLGFVDDGQLYVAGRLKDLVIVNGVNHHPEDLEWTAQTAAAGLRVGHGAVFSVDDDARERIVLAQEIEPRYTADEWPAMAQAIRAAVWQAHDIALDEVLLVRSGDLPRTSSGKIRRQATKARYLDQTLAVLLADHRATATATATATASAETALGPMPDPHGDRAAWVRAAIAHRAGGALSADTRLSDLGLDSLALFELCAAIEQATGVVITPAELMAAGTPEAVAAQVAQCRAPATDPSPGALPPAQRDAPGTLPLNVPQRALWFAQRLHGANAMFNLPHATRVRGGLRVARLQAALDAWVARYPALQGAIVEQDGEPQMRIDPTARVVVQVDQTLRGLAPEPQAAALAARLHALAAAPFALEVAPLLRATWIALDDDDGVLVFVAHHLIIDGWSAARLIAQLQDRWQAPDEVFGAPGAVALPAWRVQQALARCPLQHAYWMARLADIEALALPTDRPRPAEPSFAGGVRHFSVAAPVWRAVKAAAAAARVTPFVWLLASFQVMLMRLSGQHDITVGTPVAARARAGFDDQIGMWTYTVPLRTDLSGRPSMAELVERMAPRVLDDLAHHEFDLDAVVRAYGMPRELNRNPIYQVGFAFQSMGPLALNLPGFACTPVAVHTGTARTDLWLALEGRDDGLHGEFEFNRALFDASTIDAYARAFVQLLEAGVRAPEQPVHALSLLDAAERQRVLVDFNASDARFDGPAFVHDWIAAQAARTPQAVAVQFGTQTLCYAELQTQAYQLAHRLQQLGVRPGDFVGVSLERSFALVVGVLGIFHAGAVYVPMDPTLPTDRLRFMLDDTRAQVVLVQRGASAGVMWRVAHPLFMDDPAERARQATLPATSPAVALTAESPAYVIYTSGSTGQPKGVVIGHGAMRNHKCWNIRVVGLTARDRVLHKTTISFDASVWELLTPLMVGGAVVLARPGDQRDTYRLVRTVRECGITHLTMTPSAARALLSEPELADCHTLRWLLCGGEVLDAALVQALMARRPGLTVGNFYGPSEATEDTSCHVMTAPPPGGEPVPVGRPVANTQCYVLDAERQPLPAGLRGELWIGGAGVALGYLNRPDLTAERFTDNPWASGRLYRTGDLGRWRSSGVLDVSGRVDHQIKLRGFRIELGEIEHALRACPGVAEAAVVVREDRPGMRALIAYVAGPAGAEAALAGDELRRVLAEHLPEYMVPTVWVVLPRLPRLPNGKLDRQQLPAPAEASAARSARPPQGDTEVLVWRLWAEVLGTERFDALDNFFALGGHSLLLTQVASRLRDRHGIDLPLRTLFAAPTVADLAASIEAARQSGGPGAASVPPAAAGAPGKVSRDAALLASYSQRRMWLVQQFDPETTAYNVSVSAHLRGDFDRAAFVRAAQWLVDRHEAFRTRFEVRGGEPLQRIDAQGGPALHEADLTALAPEARREAARRMLRERGATRFDLAAGPLHTWTLLRLGEGEWVFGLVMHHAVCDNWSITVLLRDFLAAYVGTPPATDATRLDYADFAVWQRQQLDTRVLSPQIEYWRHQLAGARASELPTDRPRPLHLDASGARLRVSVPDHLQQRLLTVSAALHATPFMVLLACFQVLVGRYTQDDDIVLGSPIANRHWPGSEAIVGTLVNTLVMRTSLAGNPRFDELVARTRQTAIDAYAHQDVSYDLLIETLAQEQTTRPEFVRLMFNVLNAPLGRVSYAGLVVDEFDFDRVSAQFDLSIHADLELDQVLYLEYSTALFERATAERFLANYLALLEQVLQAPQRFIHDYRVPTAMELRQLDAWNARGQAYEASLLLPAAFHARARVQCDAPAIRTQTDVWRYGELSDAAHRIARGLRAAGIGRGQRVGVCVERSPAMVAAQLGILEAGAAYVPLDPGFPAERLGYMAEDAVLAVVIVQPDTAALFAGQTCLALSDLLSADLPPLPLADDPARDARPNDAAYVIYTSGSTGRPKGVVVHHQGVMNFLWSMAKTPGMTAHDHVLAVTTISFDIAVLELFLPLVVGGQISLATREQAGDAHALRQWLDQHPITLMQATPSTWRMLIDAGWQGRQGFKALVGGEALPPDLARALLDRVDALWNMYGPTETTVWSTCCRVEAPDRGIRIGEPIANTTVHVLDARGERCPIGVPGEIYIGGDGVTLGYWQRPTLTAERFVADPFGADSAHTDAFGASAPVDGLPPRLYRTGDRGRWMADGQLEHLGRLDFQVKVRGYRIELGEIETVLRTHPAVRDAVVVVREERVGDARLVAYYVADAAVLAGALRDHLRERLPDYMLPQAYMALDQIPLLPNGKVNRQALPVPEAAAPAHRDDVLAPSTPAEQAIAQIWRTLLGIEDISVNDSFFDLGGHSLLAMRAVIEIERALGVRVAPRRLIYETLAQLAANLEGT